MKIFSKLKLSVPVIMAPMAGITSLPFRLLNRKFGCECAFTEMIDARSLCHLNKKTEEALICDPSDRPLGVQLLGSESRYILKAMEKLECFNFDILDLNAACPKKKIIKKNKGASLLKDPKKLRNILKDMVKHTSKYVTVKIRLGWDKHSDTKDIVRYIEDSGIHAIFIHGRTRTQDYRGKVNYEAIRKAKESISIPVIASGDIFSPELAMKMFSETGCDGIIVARGALGNPWIFNNIKSLLQNKKDLYKPGIKEIKATMKEHLKLYFKYYSEKRSIVKFRKFFSLYTYAFKNVRHLRFKTSSIHDKKQLLDLIDML